MFSGVSEMRSGIVSSTGRPRGRFPDSAFLPIVCLRYPTPYATSDGTATAGADYTADSGTLSFAIGETEKTVSVDVLDDTHDEGSETMTFTLSNPVPSATAKLGDATATGTINNSDPMPQAWIARFGRTVGSRCWMRWKAGCRRRGRPASR